MLEVIHLSGHVPEPGEQWHNERLLHQNLYADVWKHYCEQKEEDNQAKCNHAYGGQATGRSRLHQILGKVKKQMPAKTKNRHGEALSEANTEALSTDCSFSKKTSGLLDRIRVRGQCKKKASRPNICISKSSHWKIRANNAVCGMWLVVAPSEKQEAKTNSEGRRCWQLSVSHL